MTTSCTTFVLMSASVRPVSTAERDIGSERKVDQALQVLASPSAVTKPPNTIDWTMIPGIKKST